MYLFFHIITYVIPVTFSWGFFFCTLAGMFKKGFDVWTVTSGRPDHTVFNSTPTWKWGQVLKVLIQILFVVATSNFPINYIFLIYSRPLQIANPLVF